MTYDELKKVARPHIREGEKLPSNALLLLAQLHIPYKTENQCEKDFEGKICPLKNTPAFLYIDSEYNKTVYFNINTTYWNFYIFHEIAHYLLGHENNSPQNEIDADILACILAAPIENLPSYLKSARDLSSLCQIPIDKAEMYWQEIKREFSTHYKKLGIIGCAVVAVLSLICLFPHLNKTNEKQEHFPSESSAVVATPNSSQGTITTNTYYKTASGTHYHVVDCQHVRYKTNIIPVSVSEITNFNLLPCEDCIK